ncbi:MAG: sugar ABC transporter ATP-binding protein [Victivallales bacterium]|nr:sugar ABC transporter ATP-binding protein [Victivallales bacterium]
MRVTFEHISKSFGPTEVLHDVSLTISDGQIFALLGENGAGKSTLMNILGGLIAPSAGQILLDGKPVQFHSPNDSLACGIAFIHQELNPVNDLRVYENIFLGREIRQHGFMSREAMRRQSKALLDKLGIAIDENCFMRELGASHKQIVEIARSLLCDAKTIIMDEPTTSLTEQEINLIFTVVRTLSSQGVTIIFISHKLNEVKELCSDYAVLRNGSIVAQGAMSDVTPEILSEHIVGHELAQMRKAVPRQHGAEVLRCEGLTLDSVFQDIDLTVHEGEILGVTGLLGDGRSELFRCIFGDIKGVQGNVFLDGKPYVPRSATSAVTKGIAYVPSNRKENAIVPDLSILDNSTLATLKRYKRHLLVNKRKQTQEFLARSTEFHLKYSSPDDLITTLSGGNQQKVILARWLYTHPRLLILDNPTQGVDIGAKQEIYEIIRETANNGVAVIVLSGEGQEIIRLCERAIVMYHGRIAGELKGDELTEQAIMRLATGIKSGNT